MKIESTPPRKHLSKKKDSTTGLTSSFSVNSTHITANGYVRGGRAEFNEVSSEAIVALQEVYDHDTNDSHTPSEHIKFTLKVAHNLLDMLDILKHDILTQQVNNKSLHDIRQVIDLLSNRQTNDKNLQLLLNQIETRARTELAKYNK